MRLQFFVLGTPIPQGSTKAFVVTPRATGRPRAVVTHDNPQTRPWREAVGWGARQAMQRARMRMTSGAVTMDVTFVFPCPKALPRTQPMPRHTKRPDRDKLLRALGDALAGIVYADDAQVDGGLTLKRYAIDEETPGVHVTVEMEERSG